MRGLDHDLRDCAIQLHDRSGIRCIRINFNQIHSTKQHFLDERLLRRFARRTSVRINRSPCPPDSAASCVFERCCITPADVFCINRLRKKSGAARRSRSSFLWMLQSIFPLPTRQHPSQQKPPPPHIPLLLQSIRFLGSTVVLHHCLPIRAESMAPRRDQ